jgi:hypothetical protein
VTDTDTQTIDTKGGLYEEREEVLNEEPGTGLSGLSPLRAIDWVFSQRRHMPIPGV